MGRTNGTFYFFAEPLGSNIHTYGVVLIQIETGLAKVKEDRQVSEMEGREPGGNKGELYGTEQ